MSMEEALARKKALAPKSGFNIVGIETFGDPDDQGPFLVNHFEKREDAEKEKTAQEKADPDTVFYIYGPEEAGSED